MDAFWNGCFLVFLPDFEEAKKLSSYFADFEQEKKFILLCSFLFFLRNVRMESTRQNNSINAIQETRQLLNELRSNLSHEGTNRIWEKLYKKEAVYNFLKEKEQEGSLTNKQKKKLKNIDRYLKNISTHLKNLKKHLKKISIWHRLFI